MIERLGSRARFVLLVCALLTNGLCFAPPAIAAQTTLVASGSTWRYLDNGSNQGTSWRLVGFDDSSWASGAAQLGYGDGGEATVVGYGPNSSAKYITTYFRRTFTVADASTVQALTLELLRDDGAVVYLNGVEVARSNMPAGTVSYTTTASSAVGGADESTFYTSALDPAALVTGTNTIAVEIHQSSGTSSDVSFDLRLIASDSPPTASVTRGPYLQTGTPTSVVVKWRTNVATDSRVRYGASAASLTSEVGSSTSTTEHEVTLSGLLPATTYYYSVGTSTGALTGGDGATFFVTSPQTGVSTPSRVWVLGDSGTANSNAQAVRNAYYAFTGATHTNLWLMLGDNAYDTGTDANYQAAVFDMYPEMLRKSVLWSTIGNHDTAQSTNPPPSLPYFSIFTLPTNGEAGGTASGTERYYSFDYGDVHYICLDSMTSDRSPTGPMLTWLRNDLASTNSKWIVAFWHHPPYTKGSHNSDTETQLVEMRQNALPILEEGGVDLVLTGHSHSYERSFLIDGHYGSSTTFTASMKKDGGSGREDGTGAYVKPTDGNGANEGAVYAVAGSSGQISGGTLNHPAMFVSLNNLGSMVLDFDGPRLDVKFIRENGTVADYFTIRKGATVAAPSAPASLTATAVSTSRIDLAWSDTSSNEDGFRVERSTDGTTFSVVATLGAGVTSYQSTGLASATTYSYRVRAFNAAGESIASNVATATTLGAAPAAPTNLVATPASKTKIDLAWSDNAGDETGFEIERSTNGTTFTRIATVGANATSYTSTGLKRNTTYSYRVRAVNASGASAYSNTASATTLRRRIRR
jgi:hypothetical protein